MLCNNTLMSGLGQGYWECWRVEGTHTRDTGEKTKACHSILAAVRRIQSAASPPSLWLRISVLLRLHREMAVDYLQINKHMRDITLLHFKNWSLSVTH